MDMMIMRVRMDLSNKASGKDLTRKVDLCFKKEVEFISKITKSFSTQH